MNEKYVIEIALFADSGHHFRFLALPQKFFDGHAELNPTQILGNQLPWREHPSYPWIRYRFGTSEGALGVWVVVESNLGLRTRGYLLKPREEIPKQVLSTSDYDDLATPYAFRSLREIPAHALTIPLDPYPEVIVDVVWKRPGVKRAVEVDLIVDFGNTRTVALLLEDNTEHKGIDQFPHICQPLRFIKRGSEYTPNTRGPVADDLLAIVDSWVVLHEPLFSAFEPPENCTGIEDYAVAEITDKMWIFESKKKYLVAKTTRVPQMFVELSPALLGGGNGAGGAKQTLLELDLKRGGHYFLSSPKRYAWDHQPRGESGRHFWTMALNGWSAGPGRAALPHLRGPVLLFMDPDGRDDWNVEMPPAARPNAVHRPHADGDPAHPNGDAMTWAALTILEKAYAQMHSERYRTSMGDPFVPRRLRNVMVTFPPGWTAEELEAYQAKWQKAINIFTLGHLRDSRKRSAGGDRPDLIMDLDEAVASQLPIIFSEIQHMSNGESWFELVGCGKGCAARARIMNIDIGGGTTDVSVVEYGDVEPGTTIALETKLLFRNSVASGGDALVKRIIEVILLPLLTHELSQRVKDQEPTPLFERLRSFFIRPPTEYVVAHEGFEECFARAVRLVLVPIVNRWLTDCSQATYGLDGTQGWSVNQMRSPDGQPTIDDAVLEEFNELVGDFLFPQGCPQGEAKVQLLPGDLNLNYDQTLLHKCIRDQFEPFFRSLARFVAGFNCNMVIVSGKPSELPPVWELLCRCLPLLPHRIIRAKSFPAGRWYPMANADLQIGDAKTVTAVGAAIYMAIRSQWIERWRIARKEEALLLQNNAWGVMPPAKNPAEFEKNLILASEQDRNTVSLLPQTRIGRKRFASRFVMPDQVYVFDWRPTSAQKRSVTKPIRATVARCITAGVSGESLKLESVEGTDDCGQAIGLEDVELRLCTLPEGAFWMDRPSFNMERAAMDDLAGD